MKNLLRFEIYKLRKQKSMYLCTAAMLGMLFFSMLLTLALVHLIGGEFMEKPSVTFIVLSATDSANFTLIAGIFIALFVCGDFSQQTIKNIYSRGFSRVGVYFSKLIICAAYVVVAFVICELFALGVGSAFFGYKAEEGHIAALLLGQLLVCLAYASFVFSISFMVKKTGVAIALAIFVPLAVSLVFALADIGIQMAFDSDKFLISDYWLDGISTNLNNPAASVKDIVVGCVLPVVYSALFITLGIFVHKEAEV